MTVRELHVGLIPAMKRFNWKYNSRQGHLYHYSEELKKYQKMLAANPNDTSFRVRQLRQLRYRFGPFLTRYSALYHAIRTV